MNKGELIKAVADKSGLAAKDVNRVFAAAEEAIVEALKAGDKVTLVGFGTFEVKTKAARIGVNPATGAKVTIPASKNPSLKFGKAFKNIFN